MCVCVCVYMGYTWKRIILLYLIIGNIELLQITNNHLIKIVQL